MNITRENIDSLNAILKVEVNKSDYQDNVEKVLREYRKNVNMKGFRPGMVPIGIIRKLYGTAAKIDEINKLVTENLARFIREENIQILGEPVPSDNQNEPLNWETGEDFNFTFEIGLAPEFELKLGKKNKVPYYEIIIDEKIRNNYINNYTRRYGRYVNAEVTENTDMLKGRMEPADETARFSAEDVMLAIDIIKDEEIKKEFIGKKPGDSIIFDLKKAYPNANEVAAMLKINKDQAEKAEGTYKFTIEDIMRFKPAEIGQELFDQIYGEGVIKTEEEFYAKIDEEISASLANESNYKLSLDLKELALEKTEFDLPEEFLKKWLQRVNDKVTPEQIEKEFDTFREDLKWQLIRKKIAQDYNIKVTEEEMRKEAEVITRYQFNQYGLFYATDEQISKFAGEMLKKEDDARRIADRILEQKAIEKLKELVTIENKKVTSEEFDKLFE
ncbi:MAG TPA: trigger factor [Bacteroidales bacterium]|mgnify:CR=1 FL=1|nr:trigger factor [Bacteroidales bacterium]HOK75230.1 trigger factor [Bacteroidales bacterium]HOM40650.1 trigger factor [Bacteroidales bacterium]HPP92750.1 trigger factor [Bacteroidales bacterium]HQG57298.1 trigger factor [Bacteroidales bacterium]